MEEGTLNANKKITIKFCVCALFVLIPVAAADRSRATAIIKQYNIIMMMMIVTDDA